MGNSNLKFNVLMEKLVGSLGNMRKSGLIRMILYYLANRNLLQKMTNVVLL